MQIFVQHGGQQLGPFTEAELKAQLASGAISLDDHVWWQGQGNWIPLSQSQFAPGATPAIPGTPVVPGTPLPVAGPNSNLALAALICGCVSIICWLLASLPAIILGHMGLSQIKKNPGMQGRGMALAGLILGYVTMGFFLIYIIAIITLMSLGNQVTNVFQTIQSQLNAAAMTNSDSSSTDQNSSNSDSSSTNSDTSTNAPSTTSPDQSTTNSTPGSTDSSTNADGTKPASGDTNSANQ